MERLKEDKENHNHPTIRKVTSEHLTFKYNAHNVFSASLERAGHAESVSLMFSFWISHSFLFCQHYPSVPCPYSHVRCKFEREIFWSKLDFLLESAAVLICFQQCPLSWARGIHHTNIPLGKIWTALGNIWVNLLKKLIPITASHVPLNCSLNPCCLFPTSSKHSGHILYEMWINCFL